MNQKFRFTAEPRSALCLLSMALMLLSAAARLWYYLADPVATAMTLSQADIFLLVGLPVFSAALYPVLLALFGQRMEVAAAIAEVEAQGVAVDVVLLDGNPLHLDPREVNVVKGDGKCASIAAASLVAKVARDHVMEAYAEQYPGYGFESNKGYGSEGHMAAIRERGLCPIHRRSFCSFAAQESLF